MRDGERARELQRHGAVALTREQARVAAQAMIAAAVNYVNEQENLLVKIVNNEIVSQRGEFKAEGEF